MGKVGCDIWEKRVRWAQKNKDLHRPRSNSLKASYACTLSCGAIVALAKDAAIAWAAPSFPAPACARSARRTPGTVGWNHRGRDLARRRFFTWSDTPISVEVTMGRKLTVPAKALAKFKVPDAQNVFVHKEQLPKGATGKLDKKGLREQMEDGRGDRALARG